MIRFAARPIWVALIGLVVSLAGIVSASAHATLINADPRDGAMLATAPSELVLVFNEPIAPLVFTLLAPDGRASTPRVEASDRTVRVRPEQALPDGTSILSWRVISADGHPVGGSIAVSVRARTGNAGTVQGSRDVPLGLAIWLSRAALYCGLLFGVGGVFFAVWAAPAARQRLRPLFAIALPAGAIALVVSVGLLGVDALGLRLGAIFTSDPWLVGIRTSVAMTAVIAAISLVFAYVAARSSSMVVARSAAAIAVLCLAAAFASSGHASVARPQLLMRPAVFIHVAAVALWAGSLIPLLAVMSGGRETVSLSRFSRHAPLVIAALVVSGVALAIVQLARVPALWDTGYGLVFLTKMAVLGVVGLLACINRFVLTPKVLRGNARARRSLARSIAAEIALVVVLFGIVALWRFTPPPRSLASDPPVFTHLHGGGLMANVTFSPQSSELSLDLLQPDFTPLQPKEVTVRLLNPSAGIEPITRTAKRDSTGRWVIDNVALVKAGSWTVEIDALVTDFDKLSVSGPLSSGPATPPPDDSAFVHIHGLHAMADVRLTPGRAGMVRIEIRLMRDDFTALSAQTLSLSLSHPEQTEPITLPVRRSGDGEWKAGPTTLPRSGVWTVKLELGLPSGQRELLDGPIILEPGSADKKGDRTNPSE